MFVCFLDGVRSRFLSMKIKMSEVEHNFVKSLKLSMKKNQIDCDLIMCHSETLIICTSVCVSVRLICLYGILLHGCRNQKM